MSHTLLQALDSLGRPRVLVVGDLILDRYCWGDAERVSQEAPVLVLRAQQREARLGGAANVCQMLRGLEAEVVCAGVIGMDEAGRELRDLLDAAGIEHRHVLDDPNRPTTTKERFIGRAAGRHPHQILRVDREMRQPVRPAIQQQLQRRLAESVDACDVLLISDYGKGVCTPALLRQLIGRARRAGKPVIIDPQLGTDYQVYRGATCITPNRTETEHAAGCKILQPADALAAGHALCRQLQLDMLLVTLDREGMALVRRDGTGRVFPTQAKEVYDITGAGDMVLAAFGLALAGGLPAETAVRLSNVAAGLEVEQFGVAVIRRDALRARALSLAGANARVVTLKQMECLAEMHRRAGQAVVFTNGCFDLLHVGHVTCLEQAARMGDVLVVALNSDRSVRRLKGKGRPVMKEQDRAAVLASLECVDYVLVFDDDTPHELLRRIRPDVLVKGGTYQPDEIVGREIVEAYGGRVCVTGKIDGVSTTRIVASLAKQAGTPTSVKLTGSAKSSAPRRRRRLPPKAA